MVNWIYTSIVIFKAFNKSQLNIEKKKRTFEPTHFEGSAESESLDPHSISAPLIWAEMEWGPHSHFLQSLQNGLA